MRREGYRATRGFAGNAFSHRLDVSSRRVRAVRALGRTAPRDARRGFSTSPGFLAEGPARCARVTGGVCDAARHHVALSDSMDVHGRPGTRVVRVAMLRAVHHARQTATRRRSRVFRVSPVCEAREKSHHALREVYRHPDASTRGARPLVRIHLNALRHTTQRADRCTPSSYSNDTQVEEPPLAPSTRCPSRAPSAR